MKTDDMTTRNKIACLILIPMGLPFRGLLVKSPSTARRTLSLSPLPETPMSPGRRLTGDRWETRWIRAHTAQSRAVEGAADPTSRWASLGAALGQNRPAGRPKLRISWSPTMAIAPFAASPEIQGFTQRCEVPMREGQFLPKDNC